MFLAFQELKREGDKSFEQIPQGKQEALDMEECQLRCGEYVQHEIIRSLYTFQEVWAGRGHYGEYALRYVINMAWYTGVLNSPISNVWSQHLWPPKEVTASKQTISSWQLGLDNHFFST